MRSISGLGFRRILRLNVLERWARLEVEAGSHKKHTFHVQILDRFNEVKGKQFRVLRLSHMHGFHPHSKETHCALNDGSVLVDSHGKLGEGLIKFLVRFERVHWEGLWEMMVGYEGARGGGVASKMVHRCWNIRRIRDIGMDVKTVANVEGC